MKKLLCISILMCSIVNCLLPMKKGEAKSKAMQYRQSHDPYALTYFQQLLTQDKYNELHTLFTAYTNKIWVASNSVTHKEKRKWHTLYDLLSKNLGNKMPAKGECNLENVEALLALMEVHGSKMNQVLHDKLSKIEFNTHLLAVHNKWIDVYKVLPKDQKIAFKRFYEKVKLSELSSHYVLGDFITTIKKGTAFCQEGIFHDEHKNSMQEETHFFIGASYFNLSDYPNAFKHFFKAHRADQTISDETNACIEELFEAANSNKLLEIYKAVQTVEGPLYLKELSKAALHTLMLEKSPDNSTFIKIVRDDNRSAARTIARFRRQRQCVFMEHDEELAQDNQAIDD